MGGHIKPVFGDILHLFHRRRRDENSEVVLIAIHEPDCFIRTVQKGDLVVLHLHKVLQDIPVDYVYLEAAQAPVVVGVEVHLLFLRQHVEKGLFSIEVKGEREGGIGHGPLFTTGTAQLSIEARFIHGDTHAEIPI